MFLFLKQAIYKPEAIVSLIQSYEGIVFTAGAIVSLARSGIYHT